MFTATNSPAPSVIFENDKIKITTTGRDYDFIATVSNLTNYPIIITFMDDDFDDSSSEDDPVGNSPVVTSPVVSSSKSSFQ